MHIERYLFKCEICSSTCTLLDCRLSTKQGMGEVFSPFTLCARVCMPSANGQRSATVLLSACCLLTQVRPELVKNGATAATSEGEMESPLMDASVPAC